MCRVARSLRCSSGLYRFTNSQLRFLANQVFYILAGVQTCRVSAFPRPRVCREFAHAVSTAHQLVHRVETGKRIAGVKELPFVERFQIVLNIAAVKGAAPQDGPPRNTPPIPP